MGDSPLVVLSYQRACSAALFHVVQVWWVIHYAVDFFTHRSELCTAMVVEDLTSAVVFSRVITVTVDAANTIEQSSQEPYHSLSLNMKKAE